MDFDPSFLDKLSDHSRIFPEYTKNSDIPTMVPLQQTSTLVSSPPKNIFLYNQDNFHHFQCHHPFNGEHYDPCFVIEAPSSSINPLPMIQTPSSGNSYANWSQRNVVNSYYPIGFAPNNNKMEVTDEYLNNCKGFLDFPQEISIQHDAISQPQVVPSLAPPPHVYASVVANPRLQDELSHITGAGNGHQETSQKNIVGANKEQKITNTIKSQWTLDEDKALVESVRCFGLKKWSHIAKLLNGRVGKQCRERWFNHLRPNIRKESWSDEEDLILIEAHKDVGNKWVEIAKRLVGRTENTIKNHWNATKRRLNTKRQVNKSINPKGELLLNYIKQVTIAVAKRELMKSMSEINLRSENHNDLNLDQVWFDSSMDGLNTKDWGTRVYGNENDGVDWKLHSYNPTTSGGDGYVPMMVNGGEMASGSGMEDI